MVSIQIGTYLFLVLFTLLFAYWVIQIFAFRYNAIHTTLIALVVLLGWYVIIF